MILLAFNGVTAVVRQTRWQDGSDDDDPLNFAAYEFPPAWADRVGEGCLIEDTADGGRRFTTVQVGHAFRPDTVYAYPCPPAVDVPPGAADDDPAVLRAAAMLAAAEGSAVVRRE